MHIIHTTPGFILQARPYSEAGKMFSVYTRDLGLVQAAAQGIRLEKSKLRYHMQEYTFGTFSLVRGKEVWRLTGAECVEEYIPAHVRDLRARLSLLLSRFLQGEEPHPELFACLQSFMNTPVNFLTGYSTEYESLIVLRILNLLGYVGNVSTVRPFIESTDITEDILKAISPIRREVIGLINTSIHASHL